MVHQNCFYKRSKSTTTYKTLVLMPAKYVESKTLNIMAANISGFTVCTLLYVSPCSLGRFSSRAETRLISASSPSPGRPRGRVP